MFSTIQYIHVVLFLPDSDNTLAIALGVTLPILIIIIAVMAFIIIRQKR